MGFSSQMKAPLALGVYLESRGRTQLPTCRHPFPLGTSLGIPPTSLDVHGSPVHPVPYLPALADVLGMVQPLSKGLKCLH